MGKIAYGRRRTEKKIGTAVNTDDLEKELDTVKGQLRQLLSWIREAYDFAEAK